MSAELYKRLFLLLILSRQTWAKKPARIKVTNINKCDADSANPVTWSYEIRNADEDGYKIVDMEFDVTNGEMNNDVEYVLTVDKFNNGDWQTDVYTEEGKLCEMINKYVPKAWQKFSDKLDPKPKGFCEWEKKVYRVKDFELSKDDTQIPPLFGKIRGILKVFDKDNTVTFCGGMEMDITEE